MYLSKETALVVDNSGSMQGRLDVFLLNHILKVLTLDTNDQCHIDLLLDVAKRYKKVYFLTDNELDPREMMMIKLAGNIEVLTV